jgi:hypothetical protein
VGAPLGTVPSSHLGGIGLDLVLTCLAPHDDPHAGHGRTAGSRSWDERPREEAFLKVKRRVVTGAV